MYIPNPHPVLAALAPNGQPKLDFLAYLNGGWVITADDVLANPSRPGLCTVKLLPEAAEQPRIIPRGMVHHTQGGTKKATNQQVWSLCSRQEWKSEPTIIGPDMDRGAVIHAIPFTVRADSNSKGNAWVFDGKVWGHCSTEAQDSGSASVPLAKDPFTLAQLDTLIGIDTAFCVVYHSSCGDMPTWQSSGIAPHNRHPEFTNAGHNCPGPARTLQMDYIRSQVAQRLAAYFAAVGGSCPGAA